MQPKILVLYDKNGCCFWRSYQPGMAVRQSGLADVHFLELRITSKNEIAEELKWCDIVHVMGFMQLEALLMMRQWQNLGRKVIVDFDDLHYNVSPFNIAYRKFGLEDVQVRDPKTGDIKFLWKDGTDGFDIKANTIKFQCYQQILKEADLITTTTLYLRDAIKEIQPEANVKVLPNAIDLTQWKPLDCREKFSDKFRFGWAVSDSHGEDWLSIKPALSRFLETHKDAKFVCVGDTFMDITAALPKEQVECHPFSDLWEGHYALRMPLLGLDCAIAPLHDLEFNKCKSPLKFAEYTAFGWPVIAQNMLPYSECMISGVNGLLAKSTEDWVGALDLLYRDKQLRSKLHFEAMFTIKSLFNMEEAAKDYIQIYKELLGVTNAIS